MTILSFIYFLAWFMLPIIRNIHWGTFEYCSTFFIIYLFIYTIIACSVRIVIFNFLPQKLTSFFSLNSYLTLLFSFSSLFYYNLLSFLVVYWGASTLGKKLLALSCRISSAEPSKMSSFADPFTGLLNIANDINLANEVYDKDTSITFSSSTPSSFSSFISSSSYSLLPSPNPENSDLIYNFVAPAISRALSDVDLRVTPELLQRLLNPLPTPPSTPSSSSSYSGEWLAGSALLRSLASKYLSPTDQHDFAMETLSMSRWGRVRSEGRLEQWTAGGKR